MPSPPLSEWKLPAALMLLSLVPVLPGLVRLFGLFGLISGAEPTAENARFLAAPLPVLLHVLAATVYCLLGAWQFSAGFRRRRPAWHRAAGRLLVACGLLAGASGLWMTLFYPIGPLLQGDLLLVVRLAVGAGMLASITLGVLAIRRRDTRQHQAWMTRAYALGQGAGTQVLIFLGWALLTAGPIPTGLTRDLLMSLAWALNLALAEWVIRRPTTFLTPTFITS